MSLINDCPNVDKSSPIDIDSNKVYGPCSLKCNYNYNYPVYTVNVENKGTYLKLNYSGPSNPVVFNDIFYTPTEIRIYRPSLHKYNNEYAKGEILIIHGGSGKNLIVSIPIVMGSKNDAATVQLKMLLEETLSRAQNNGESLTLSSGDFTLNKFVPNKKPFYSYTGGLPYSPCNGTYNYVVYSMNNAINIDTDTLSKLNTIISANTTSLATNTNYFYNVTGGKNSLDGGEDDQIYIDCQPVNEKGEILVDGNGNSKSDSLGFEGIDFEQIQPFLYVIGGIVGAIAIAYGINYVMNAFKKTDSGSGTDGASSSSATSTTTSSK